VQFPHAVKNIFHAAQQAVSERFPEMGHQFVGGFYFLRFICPALVAPAAYGLVKSDLAPENQRTLILISKVLQNLSNHILFGEKEPFMMFMNPFINKNSRKMADCLQTLVKKASESAPTQNGTVIGTHTHTRYRTHTHTTAHLRSYVAASRQVLPDVGRE
jgi:hypothetical protein